MLSTLTRQQRSRMVVNMESQVTFVIAATSNPSEPSIAAGICPKIDLLILLDKLVISQQYSRLVVNIDRVTCRIAATSNPFEPSMAAGRRPSCTAAQMGES